MHGIQPPVRLFPWLQDWRILVPFSLMVSAGVLFGAVLIYYLTNDRFIHKTAKNWQGSAFALIEGQGKVNGDKLVIEQVSDNNKALVIQKIEPLKANEYASLHLDIELANPNAQLHFVWITEDTPQFLRWLELPNVEQKRWLLEKAPGWYGMIIGIGLEIDGAITGSLILNTVELQRSTPHVSNVLAQLWREWCTLEAWQGYSINIVPGGPREGLLPPALAIAIWISLAILLCVALTFQFWILPLLLLSGWIVLDVRWQIELLYTLELAYQQYADKSAIDKLRIAADGELYDSIAWIKQTLPAQPVRLLLLNANNEEKNNYIRLRARYHLLPHNVLLHHGLNGLRERLDALQKDDYLLVLGELPGLDFADGKLHWADKQAVPVEKVLQGPSATLYQLQ